MSPDPWTEAMMCGDFAAAWRVCDRVLAQRRGRDCSHQPRHLQHVWDGSAPDGQRVLVRCYHGLGDTLQFVRLLEPLRARARRITLWVQPALLRLLDGVRGVDAILPLHDGAPDVDCDVEMELMEITHVLRLSARDLPGRIPYLRAPALPLAEPRIGDELSVGVAWRGGSWNTERSLTPEALSRLADVERVRWFSLQYPPERPPFAMTELGCRDIGELAARMSRLDLIISVDTMTVHLAGGLGLPVWTLLPETCDWRWMRARADTPWYPTMRLFRQAHAGEWREVVEAVAGALTRARDIRSAGCRASSG